MDSGFSEKMDTLDLIISALKDHEKRLDDISHRLESLYRGLRIDEVEAAKKEERRAEPLRDRKGPVVVYRRWDEFKDACKGAKTVAFEVEGNSFHISSIVNGNVLGYSEELPDKLKVVEEMSCFSIDKRSLNDIDLLQFLFDGRLRCGVRLSIESSRTVLSDKEFLFELRYDFDPDEVKDFLTRELDTSKGNIVEGKITY